MKVIERKIILLKVNIIPYIICYQYIIIYARNKQYHQSAEDLLKDVVASQATGTSKNPER